MSSLCSPVVDDLIYEGLTAVLRVIPGCEDDEVRQSYESLVHTLVAMYDSYRDLELLLEQKTGMDGDMGDDTSLAMRVFRLAWNFVDSAYSFQMISQTKIGKGLISLPDEISTEFKRISDFRNYSNHLRGQLKNVSKANNFAPLFGFVTYQATPYYMDESADPHHFFVAMLSSSSIKGSYNIHLPSYSSETVFGFIDCISLHIKRNLHFNISRFVQNIIVFINDWQIEQINNLVKKAEVGGSGLSSPFNRMVVRANLPSDHPINRYVIDEDLERNKIRVQVTFSAAEAAANTT